MTGIDYSSTPYRVRENRIRRHARKRGLLMLRRRHRNALLYQLVAESDQRTTIDWTSLELIERVVGK